MKQNQYQTDKVIKPQAVLWLNILAGIGAIITIGQISYLLVTDNVLCMNEGCEVVESLLRIPPIGLNSAGAIYFLILLVATIMTKHQASQRALMLIRILLLCGIAAEGILFSYQAFVIKTFCSYCLLICAIIFIMNIFAGWRQLLLSGLVFYVEIILFSILQFHTPVRNQDLFNIDHGTYAIKRCDKIEKQLYLLFSDDCPHCHNVLDILENCTHCEVRLNPLQSINNQLFPGLTPIRSYSPDINILMLKTMGINTVPVLIEKLSDGLRFIKGAENILFFLKNNCFDSSNIESVPFELSAFQTPKDDECNMDISCGDKPSIEK